MKRAEWQSLHEFYKGKRVLVTGHTGFKGMWMTKMLQMLGANVTGYALASPTKEGGDVFRKIAGEDMRSILNDIRDYPALKETFDKTAPDIVFHLAAQPLVLEGYANPVYTYETNIMGTVHLLECIRLSDSVRSCVIVTTDKVYENKEWIWGYRENDVLNGNDPYANSKSCVELVVSSYNKSFLREKGTAVSTVRAGNVIGGGDFSENRIVPDCVRAALAGKKIHVRNPHSVRPYQHVLEALSAYLLVAARQWDNISMADSYNIGPREQDTMTTGALAQMFCEAWGNGLEWYSEKEEKNHGKEANLLWLDCAKIRYVFGWTPQWNARTAIEKTVEWFKGYEQKVNLETLIEQQIKEFWEGDRNDG